MKKYLLLLSLCVGIIGSDVHATHMMGSDITYECLGNEKYKVTLKIYRDCTGLALNGITCSISSGSNSASFTPIKKRVTDLTPVCKTVNSPCGQQQSSISIGVEEHVFESIIDLSKAPYVSWISNGACEFSFSWGQCCRNGEITTINNGAFYSEASVNICNIKKTKTLCNTSPTFSTEPIFYACCNTPFQMTFQANEPSDFDSLSYKLVSPLSSKGTKMTFKTPFSETVPMTPKCIPPGNVNCTPSPTATPPLGFYLNESNGDMVFNPIKCDEVGVVVVEISEWRKDTTGKYLLIGTIRRDMQIIVRQCGIAYPPKVTSNKYDYKVCEGDKIKITIEGIDQPNPQDPHRKTDSVSLQWDTAISQANFTITNPTSKDKIAVFEWQTKVGDANSKSYQFSVKATDDDCPFTSSASKSFNILVTPKPIGITSFNTYCGSNELEVDLTLDKDFNYPAGYNWKLLDSNSNEVGNSIQKKDTFSNLKNGKYYVQLTLTNKSYCSTIYMDTLQLNFKTKGKYLSLGADTTITDKDSLLLDAGNGFVSYLWNDNSTLQTLLIDGPKVKAGQFIYFVDAKDSSGCSYSDSIKVVITSTIGIKDRDVQNLIIYPTPAKEQIQIEIPTNLTQGDLKVFNAEGKMVWSKSYKEFNTEKINIDISNFAQGLYVIQFESNSNLFKAKMMKE